MPTPARVVIAPPGLGELEVRDVELPGPGPHQVVVRQFASGICHSQLHQIHRARREPVLLGHESTGEVVAVGGDVHHVAPGDIVLVTWVPRNPEAAAEARRAVRTAVTASRARRATRAGTSGTGR